MDIHQNARLTPHGRERIVRQVLSGRAAKVVADAAGVCRRTVGKGVARYRTEGAAGLRDRSSRPHRFYRPTPQEIVTRIADLRRLRWTGKQIAEETGVSPAAVSRVLSRVGLSRMKDLQPAQPVTCYERCRPGERVPIDIKKLGRFDRPGHHVTADRTGQSHSRGIGWEYVHLAIDDHSRLAYSAILPDEKRRSCLRFLFEALRFFRPMEYGSIVS